MITIISMMVTVVMGGFLLQGKFINRDLNKLKARYAAEGGAAVFLTDSTFILRDHTPVTLPDSSQVIVQSEAFGCFLKIISTAEIGNQRQSIRMLIGVKPIPQMNNAVVLGDIRSKLHLTGDTELTGDVATGPLGLNRSAFKGTLFTGRFDGKLHMNPSSPLPVFNDDFIRQELLRYKKMIDQQPESAKVIPPGRYSARTLDMNGPAKMLYSTGNLEIFSLSEMKWPENLTIITKGNLHLTGKIRYSPFNRFLAGENISVSGQVGGNHALFYAEEEIRVGDQVSGSGQFIAGKNIWLSDQIYLKYPSVLFLYLNGLETQSSEKNTVELVGEAILDGTVVLFDPQNPFATDRARMILGKDAVIRGAVYNTGRTELHGEVLGSILTHQFYFYESPSVYINWLKGSRINVKERPVHFAVPIGFSGERKYEVLDWREL